MNRKAIHRMSLLVVALGLACSAWASPQQARDINICRGMGRTCYCSGACVATHGGCQCM